MITVQYTWDVNEFIRSNKISYALKMKSTGFRYLGYFLVVATAYGLFTAFRSKNFFLLVISLVVVSYWYILKWRIHKSQLVKNFSKNSEERKEIEWRIDENGFTGSSGTGKSQFSWDALSQVVSSDEGFLLYQDPAIVFLPAHGFSSADDIQWFRETAKSKVGKFIEA